MNNRNCVILKKRKDIAGQRFGHLIAIKLDSRKRDSGGQFRYKWLFRCDCGNQTTSGAYDVTHGHTTSCGCVQRNLREEAGNRTRTHSMTKSRFYTVFIGIKTRCENPKADNYYLYGGRGIKCLWKSFEEFRDDLYESYLEHIEKFGEKNTTIERKDTNGHYCKGNCKWATTKAQARNRRYNHLVSYKGKTKCIAEWAEQSNLRYWTLYRRIKSGWPIDKALNTKV